MKLPSILRSPAAVALAAGLVIPGALVAQKAKDPWLEKKAKLPEVTEERVANIKGALPKKATAKPKKDRKILVFYRCEGFVHGSISAGNRAVEEMGKATGAFSADFADTYDVFTRDNLAQYDAILFNNTTRLKVPEGEAREAIMEFVKGGKGVIGFHAASDNFDNWPEALGMIGGIFNGHPWGAGGNWAYKLDDPKHPLNAAFKGDGFWRRDEIYWYKPESFEGRDTLRVLVSLDMGKEANQKQVKNQENIPGIDVPVSWLRTFGEGRVFYSNFGHRDDTFWDAPVLQHFLDGIQYALGDLDADATPTSKVDGLVPALAPDAPAA